MKTPALLMRVSMRPKRSSAPLMIRSVVAGSDTSPSTVSTAGSAAGLIVREVATTAQPPPLVGGDEAGADALRTSGDDGPADATGAAGAPAPRVRASACPPGCGCLGRLHLRCHPEREWSS